jgi:hypothetical protein
MPARPGCERQQQTRLLEATHRVRFAGVKRGECAVVAGGRVFADRNADASVQHLDEDVVAVPRITHQLRRTNAAGPSDREASACPFVSPKLLDGQSTPASCER